MGIGTALKVGSFIWSNRGAIMRLYHHAVHHKVVLDDIIGYAEEHPNWPANVRKEAQRKNREKDCVDSYSAAS